MANAIETTTPGTSSLNPNRLTPEAVIEQVRTLRSLIDDVTPLSKEQRLQLRQRTRKQFRVPRPRSPRSRRGMN
jgi:hypothetical protein